MQNQGRGQLMKKCLINVYFGKAPNNLQIWAKSASLNKDFDFFIFTDSPGFEIVKDKYPNIFVSHLSKTDFLNRCCECFGFYPSLDTPYKLCDYKVAYGDIFKDRITDYDFWGFFDFDVVFGNISHFLSDKIFETYQNISIWGHLSFLKNNQKMRENYKKGTPKSPMNYPNTFKNSYIWITDEFIRREVLRENNIGSFDTTSLICDMSIFHKTFKNVFNKKIPDGFICIFNNGCLYCIYETNGKIVTKEIMYIHLQKRKMDINIASVEKPIIIKPNEYKNLEFVNIYDKSWFYKSGGGIHFHPFYYLFKKIKDYKNRLKNKITRLKLLKHQ